MALRAGAISGAGGATFIVRGWWTICWVWRVVMGLFGLVWCITIPVSLAVSQVSKDGKMLIFDAVEEVESYVKVLDEVLLEQSNRE